MPKLWPWKLNVEDLVFTVVERKLSKARLVLAMSQKLAWQSEWQ